MGLRLKVVRKADFGPQDAPQLTPEQIQGQLLIADSLIQANGNLQTAVDVALQNIGGQIGGEAGNIILQSLATRAWSDSLAKVETPLLQQIVNYANVDQSIKDIAFKPSFTMSNPDAIAMAQKQAGDLAVQLTKEQHDIIRNLTALAVSGNYTVDELGRKLRNHIGLFDKWAKAVENRYEGVYKSFIKQGVDKATAQALAQKQAADYHAKLLRKRALMIARTEVLRAENDGRWLGWKSAIDEGYADPNSFKRWIVRPVGACEICQSLNGTEIPYDQPFGFGQLMPPRHPNCRCTAVLVPPPPGYVPPKPPRDLLNPSGYNESGVFEGNIGGKIPASAPEFAKPVAWNGQLDVGDLVYFDGMQGTTGYEISSVKGSTVYYKTKSGTSAINVGDLLARGKAVAIIPGAVKLSKVTIKSDVGAFAPVGSPKEAIAVNLLSSIHVGDTLYTSTLKPGQSMTVLAIDVPNNRIKVIGATGSTYWTPFNPQKNQYAVVASKNKVKAALGLPQDQVAAPKAPKKTAAGDAVVTPVYQPQVGDVVAVKGDTSTYTIKKITNKAVTLSDNTVVHMNDVLGLPTGAKVTADDGVVRVVKEVKGTNVIFQDGYITPLASIKPAKNFDVVGAVKDVPDVPAPKPPSTTAPHVIDASVVLGKKTGAPAGSNQKEPSGFWTGTDGKKRYVKLYDNPEQVYSELVANKIYRDLGVPVPETSVAVRINPKTGKQEFLIVTEIVENKGTIGNLGLNKAQATEIVDGFLVDTWLANYDAVGTGLDNVVVGTDGKIYRIDQGGSMFFRAQGKLKDTEVLANADPMQYYDNNAYYRKVFDEAGIKPNEMNPEAFFKNLDAIIAEKGGLDQWLLTIQSDMAWDAKILGVELPKQVSSELVKPYVKLLQTRLDGLKKAYGYKGVDVDVATPKIQSQAFAGDLVEPPKKQFSQGDIIEFDDAEVGMIFKGEGEDGVIFKVIGKGIDGTTGETMIEYSIIKGVSQGGKYTMDAKQWKALVAKEDGFFYQKRGYEPPAKTSNSPDITTIGEPIYNPNNGNFGFIVDINSGMIAIKWDDIPSPAIFNESQLKKMVESGGFTKPPADPPTYEQLKVGDTFKVISQSGTPVIVKVLEVDPMGKGVKLQSQFIEITGGQTGLKTIEVTYNKATYDSAIASQKVTEVTTPKPDNKPDLTLMDVEPDIGLTMSNPDGSMITIVGKTDNDLFIVKDSDGNVVAMSAMDLAGSYNTAKVIEAPTTEQPTVAFLSKQKGYSWNINKGDITGVVDMPGVSFKIRWMSGDIVHLEDAAGNVYKGVPKSSLTGVTEGLPFKKNGESYQVIGQVAPGASQYKFIAPDGTIKTAFLSLKKQSWQSQNPHTPVGVVPKGWVPGKSVDAPKPPPKAKPAAKLQPMLKLGGIIGHSDFPQNSYKIVDVLPNGKFKIESSTGKTFDADGAKLTAFGKGSIVNMNGTKYEVMDVQPLDGGDFELTLSNGTKVSLSNAIKGFQDGTMKVANTSGSSVEYSGPYAATKPKKPVSYESAKVSYGVPYTHADGALTFDTETEGVEWGRKSSANWRKQLTNDEEAAIQKYTGSYYDTMNKYLRDGGTGKAIDLDGMSDQQARRAIEQTVYGLSKSVVTEDVIVNRGIRVPDAVFDAYVNLPEGALIYDGAFMSTSVGPSAAFTGNVVLRIKVKAGQQAGYVANISYHKGEREFLIQAGSTMRVDKVHKDGGRVIMDVTIIEQEPLKGVPDPSAIGVIAVSKAKGGVFAILADLTLGRI
jgi:hypothetical protein